MQNHGRIKLIHPELGLYSNLFQEQKETILKLQGDVSSVLRCPFTNLFKERNTGIVLRDIVQKTAHHWHKHSIFPFSSKEKNNKKTPNKKIVILVVLPSPFIEGKNAFPHFQ